jgi:hypothetical protein
VGNPLSSRVIPESTIAALRELLVRMVHDEPAQNVDHAAGAGDDVRRALQALCDDAHTSSVRVEQLVIAIKEGWSSLHSLHPRARSDGPDELLNRVITRCIDEYYSPRTSGAKG